jgi:hypothetical protein
MIAVPINVGLRLSSAPSVGRIISGLSTIGVLIESAPHPWFDDQTGTRDWRSFQGGMFDVSMQVVYL